MGSAYLSLPYSSTIFTHPIPLLAQASDVIDVFHQPVVNCTRIQYQQTSNHMGAIVYIHILHETLLGLPRYPQRQPLYSQSVATARRMIEMPVQRHGGPGSHSLIALKLFTACVLSTA